MFKLPVVLGLFICFVYSNNEHNVDNPPNDFEFLRKLYNENKNIVQTTKEQLKGEKLSSKPCKEKHNRRLGTKNDTESDLFEALPVTVTLEQNNSSSTDNKTVTSSVQDADNNYKNENTDIETRDSDVHSNNCDCDNCVSKTNKKVLQFEFLGIDSRSILFDDDVVDDGSGDIQTSDPFPEKLLDEPLAEDTDVSLDSVPLNIGEIRSPSSKEVNIKTRRRKCGTVNLSENSPIAPITRRILPGLIENPNNQDIDDNKLYQDVPQLDKPNEIEVEPRQNYFPSVHKVSNTYDINLVHNMNVNEADQQNTPQQDSVENQLIEPTRGKGIYDIKDAGITLLENSRVCYACSTISDPTCWTPDRRTTVKYCRKGHQSCLAKSFKHNGKLVMIRDCGRRCVNLSGENYNSCSICHKDLCNSATGIAIYSTGTTIAVFFGILFNTY